MLSTIITFRLRILLIRKDENATVKSVIIFAETVSIPRESVSVPITSLHQLETLLLPERAQVLPQEARVIRASSDQSFTELMWTKANCVYNLFR